MTLRRTFSLTVECAGVFEGWSVEFRLPRRDNVFVRAFDMAGNATTDLHEIAAIYPLDMWPEFAQRTFRQRVGRVTEEQQERLF